MENTEHIERPENAGEKHEIIRDEKGRYIKGCSGNPAGKPKGTISITTKIRQMLQEMAEGEKITKLEALVKKIYSMAMENNNEQMIKMIWNYIDGMPKQKIDLDFDEMPTEIQIKIVDSKENK